MEEAGRSGVQVPATGSCVEGAGAGHAWLLPGTIGMISCLRPYQFVIVKVPLGRVSPTQDVLVFNVTEFRNC